MESPNIRIVVSGDYCPTENVQWALRQTSSPEDLLGEAVGLFKSADIAIANLEYPLTRENKRSEKYGSHQKGDPTSIAVLKQAGINLVTLANNHILDYGESGLLETLNTCREYDIDTVGAGATLCDARRTFHREVHGVKVAVIAFCENEFSVATERHGGAAPMDPIENFRQIQAAKQEADVVLVVIHGGNEFSHYPSPRIVKQYRFYAEVGASAVIAHHPHYLQGYEIFNGVPIFYSLGKLVYTRMKDPHVLEVPVGILELDPVTFKFSVDFRFFKMSLEKTRLENLTKCEEDDLRHRFKIYCNAIQDPAKLAGEWKRYCQEREPVYLALLTMVPDVVFRIFRRLGLERLIVSNGRRKAARLRRIENIIRCESHHHAALTILESLRGKYPSSL